MASPRKRKARFITTLVYVDEPQLILMQSGKQKVLASAIDEAEIGAYPFLATTVSEDEWQRYLASNVDLRYLFVYSSMHRLFTFDLGAMADEEIMMTPREESVPEDWLPAPRFFSRAHTEPVKLEEPQRAVQTFGLDGRWDLSDFGQFYVKFSDVYAFFLALEKFVREDVADPIKRKIRLAFSDYPFRGGSSYMNLYKDLHAVQSHAERLGVGSMAYASPGHVEVKGMADLFEEFERVVSNYDAVRDEVKAQYVKLRSYLSRAGLLNAAAERYDKDDPTGAFILGEARKLAELVDLSEFDLLYDLADRNQLAVAKIVLSYVRRVEQAFLFFAEGRVQFAGRHQ